MKISFSLFLQLSVILITLGQDKNTYMPFNVQAGIDSCIVLRELKDSSILFGKFYYDTSAQLDSSIIYNKYEYKLLFESFIYDSEGRVIESFSHDLPDEVGLYSPDDKGEWLRERRWTNRQTLIRSRFDKAGNLIKKKGYSTSFDAKKIEEKDFGFMGEYVYNSNNCLIKKIESYPRRHTKDNSMYVDTTFFECDENSKHTQMIEKQYKKKPWFNFYEYDALGNLIKEKSCYDNIQPCYQRFYEYDELSNYKSYLRIDKEGEIIENHQYTYEDTLLMHYILTHPRGDKTEMFFEYDSADIITLSHTKVLDASPYGSIIDMSDSYKYKLKYDSLNRIIDRAFYRKRLVKKQFIAREVYSYNAKNQVVKEREFNQLNLLREINLFEYNEAGLVSKKIEFDKDSVLVSSEIYLHDSLGVKIARERYDEQGYVTLYETYKYDAEGNHIGGVHYQNGYQEIIYRYYYQQDGTYDYVHVQKKKGNKIIEDFNLRYHYYQNQTKK